MKEFRLESRPPASSASTTPWAIENGAVGSEDQVGCQSQRHRNVVNLGEERQRAT